jgi:hypothetical protein
MKEIVFTMVTAALLSGCVVARAAGAVVDTGVGVAKTGVKAGVAVGDAAVDAVDEDEPQD